MQNKRLLKAHCNFTVTTTWRYW